MGTSAFSNGPRSGVPFDPPWLDDITPAIPSNGMQPDDLGNEGDDGQEDNRPDQPISKIPAIAPPRRFQNARRMLGDFVRTGDQESFRNAMGHYSKTGMGGARKAANRMRTSTRSAANLYGVLQSAREGTDHAISEWVASLTSRNASTWDIVDEIIRRVAPNGGSQDETSIRDSMAQAMEDLLERNPNVNLLHLDDNNIWRLIESFLGFEAFYRLCLDIGQVYETSELSPRARVTRMNEMQDYLKAELSAQIERLRHITPNADSKQLQMILQTALKNTFLVYEEPL